MHVGLIIGAIVAGVVAIIWVAHVMEKKRTAELEAVATDLGLDFIDKPGKDFASTFGKMYLFNQGHSRTATNVMQGEANGVAIAIFGTDTQPVAGNISTRTRKPSSASSQNTWTYPSLSYARRKCFTRSDLCSVTRTSTSIRIQSSQSNTCCVAQTKTRFETCSTLPGWSSSRTLEGTESASRQKGTG